MTAKKTEAKPDELVLSSVFADPEFDRYAVTPEINRPHFWDHPEDFPAPVVEPVVVPAADKSAHPSKKES